MASSIKETPSGSHMAIANCPAGERARLFKEPSGTVVELINCAGGVPNLKITRDGVICKGGMCQRE